MVFSQHFTFFFIWCTRITSLAHRSITLKEEQIKWFHRMALRAAKGNLIADWGPLHSIMTHNDGSVTRSSKPISSNLGSRPVRRKHRSRMVPRPPPSASM